MTATDILAELQRRGVVLVPDGDNLRYRCPKGALTPELKQALAEHKTEILSHLRDQSPPPRLVVVGDGQPPPLDRPPETREELAWLVDHLADPEAFGAWLERLMERDG